jgi:carboxyl-terminal processing protease
MHPPSIAIHHLSLILVIHTNSAPMASFRTFTILLFILALPHVPILAQQPAAQRQAITLQRQLQRLHYSPRPADDSLSASIFYMFIRELDPEQYIFTSTDYYNLAVYKYKLNEELTGSNWTFLDMATKLYRQRLMRADSITQSILLKPLEFKTDDKFIFFREKDLVLAADEKELKSKWTRRFKYILLTQAYSLASADSTKPSLVSILTKKEAELREKLRKATAKGFEETLDPAVFDTDTKEAYFNAIAAVYDPHSNYFSPRENEDFQAELSTEEYSFGLEVDENKEGTISVNQLVPGGPAWKTGELHKNDELLQLQWKGSPALTVSGADIDEVEEELAKSNHDELTITIKKANGIVRTITLRKEKIETELDVVKGYLLDGEKKIGYISLPDFYTTWEDEQGSGCANDMAKEIIMMKKENLDGLILDLRYNGGGSLNEALQLCGIFIDEGPLVAIREKEGKLVFAKDPNRGTIYDGPLLVMVNNQSASASEMVAAALQDYNRAVIVGSPTYGKATMQVVYPMDSTAKPGAKSADGFVKLTTGKLYRVSGQTAQCNGVVPDVVLPDAFDGLEYREKFMPFVIPADTARKNSYYKPLAPLPVSALAEASKARINSIKAFQEMQKSISLRKTRMANKKTEIPIRPDLFEKWVKEKEAQLQFMDEEVEEENTVFKTTNYRLEKERLQNNSYNTELNTAALQSIEKDIYIQEAFRVIKDLLQAQKK